MARCPTGRGLWQIGRDCGDKGYMKMVELLKVGFVDNPPLNILRPLLLQIVVVLDYLVGKFAGNWNYQKLEKFEWLAQMSLSQVLVWIS